MSLKTAENLVGSSQPKSGKISHILFYDFWVCSIFHMYKKFFIPIILPVTSSPFSDDLWSLVSSLGWGEPKRLVDKLITYIQDKGFSPENPDKRFIHNPASVEFCILLLKLKIGF